MLLVCVTMRTGFDSFVSFEPTIETFSKISPKELYD